MSENCQCDACLVALHKSSCAVHNAPALPVGDCDCQPKPLQGFDSSLDPVGCSEVEQFEKEPPMGLHFESR